MLRKMLDATQSALLAMSAKEQAVLAEMGWQTDNNRQAQQSQKPYRCDTERVAGNAQASSRSERAGKEPGRADACLPSCYK